MILNAVGNDRGDTENTVGIRMYLANYKNTVFYKTAIVSENSIPNETVGDYTFGRESGLWKNTDAIHTINLNAPDPISDETILTLYGLI